MRMGDYLNLVSSAYSRDGGLEGQRPKLKTKTAISIRKRLVDDLQDGAVVPPVVIGVLVDEQEFDAARSITERDVLLELLNGYGIDRLSVIDGMQRTTAMQEAARINPQVSDREVRVEFWISDRLNSLIYRMLVLNTGQVPWEIGRQLETVYGQLLHRLKKQVPDVTIFEIADSRRRSQSAQYQSKHLIELLLLFSSRKTEMDIKDRVAEDFARLDAIEATAHNDFLSYFAETIRLLALLDTTISRYRGESGQVRFKQGSDFFASFPAMVGFCSAVAIYLFDETGFRVDWDESANRMREITQAVEDLSAKMNRMADDELNSFLQFELLEERLTASREFGQVGRYEREFFKKAFLSLLRNSTRLENLAPCWSV